MPDDGIGTFKSTEHAFDAGYVLAHLRAAGLRVSVDISPDGQPTPRLLLTDERSSLVYALTVEAT